jgi:tetratricopeptide (TPR) repeat protein
MEEAGKYVDGDLATVALYRIGEAKLKQGSREEAVQYCRKAVDKTSNNENAATWVLGKIYTLLGNDEVLKICTERLQANPDSPSANLAMFEIMKLNGRYNKALEYIDKCAGFVQAGGDSDVELKMKKVEVLQMAYLKTSDNNYLHNAIAEYESLLAKMPNNTNVLNNLAYLLTDANEQLDKAVDYAKRAHEMAPNDAGLMDTYAYTLYKNGLKLQTAGKESEAKDEFIKGAELLVVAIQQYEQNKTPVPTEVYEHLGMAKEAIGEKAEAVKAYEQALEAGTGTLAKSAQDRIKTAIDRLSQ